MPNIVIHRPRSLPHYMELVEMLQRKTGHALWFRGNRKSNYKLMPSLYRHPTRKTRDELRKLEHQLMVRFRQRSLPYHSRDLRDDWEALFFMQHYGVPTRLLDWTENSLIGLHFALMLARPARQTSAVVWVLDPYAWNQTALRHVSYSGGALTAGDEDLKGYAPVSTAMGNYPVALYGAHNSPRIVAQQGVFTIFGLNKKPMEKLIQSGEFPVAALSCIVVNTSRILPIRNSLLNQGIIESVVFPDLEGLARETKRFFGFEA